MMKRQWMILVLLFVTVGLFAQQPDRPMLSQRAVTAQRVGLTDITVTYYRPGVKGREIWGKLVPYREVWRAGANEATTITFTDDVRINGHPLKAGTYSFFVKPGETRWEIIFNSNPKQWGAFFLDKSKNVLTFWVKPETIPHQEWLLYEFTDLTMASARLQLRWEKVAVSFTIQVDTDRKMRERNRAAVAHAADQLAGSALTYLEHGMRLKTALKLIEESITLRPSFGNVEIKARILGKLGRFAEALQSAKRALALQKLERNAYTNMKAYQLKQLMAQWKRQTPTS